MLMRQTLLYLPAQFIGPMTQLIAAFIWTYWLTPEQLGGYALIWSIQELAGLLLLSWWSAYVQRYASSIDTPALKRRLDRQEAFVQIAAGLAQVAFAGATLAMLFPEMASWSLFAAIAVFTVVRNLATHLSLRARAQNEARAYTANVVIGAAGGLALGLAALQIWPPSLELLLWAYTAAQLAGLAIALPMMRAPLARPAPDGELLRQSWRFGWPVAASFCFTWIGAHAIRFVVEWLSGRAAVGLMTVGWWLGLRLASTAGMVIMGAAYNVAVERMRVEGADAARSQLGVNAAMLIGLLAPICVGGWLLAGPLAAVLVEDAYVEMTAAILPAALIAGALRVFQDQCVDAGFLVFERPGIPAATSAIDAVTTVVGCIAGFHACGVIGAAWGCALAAVISSLAGVAIARRIYRFHIRPVHVAAIALAVAAMGAAVFPLRDVNSLGGLALAIGAGAFVYGGVLLALVGDLRRAILGR